MLIKTQEFKEVAATIALAVNKDAANLELVVKDGSLRLNVTNHEYFVSKIFPLENPEDFHAVVDAKLFLDLVSGITTETFEIKVKDTVVVIKAGKSSYKLPMIYENDHLAALTPITVENATVTMTIAKDTLLSILNINGVEIKKATINTDPRRKYYYIDETGCFTYTTGACINEFELEKPIKITLSDRIVKLFKLFKEDVSFCYGVDALADGTCQNKVIFAIPGDIYLAAIINCDDALLNYLQGPCAATKNYITETYSNKIVLSIDSLLAAINRLALFTRNSISGQDMTSLPATITITENDLTITDSLENSEVVTVCAGTYVDSDYSMVINIAELKLILETCKNEDTITLNCGSSKAVVITHGFGKIHNLLLRLG